MKLLRNALAQLGVLALGYFSVWHGHWWGVAWLFIEQWSFRQMRKVWRVELEKSQETSRKLARLFVKQALRANPLDLFRL